jgi:hypothetical protein
MVPFSKQMEALSGPTLITSTPARFVEPMSWTMSEREKSLRLPFSSKFRTPASHRFQGAHAPPTAQSTSGDKEKSFKMNKLLDE